MLIDVKDEAFCPFKWWLEVVEKKPFLEPLMKKIFIGLAEKLASSFSEQIFSFAGRTSKGDQSRTGVLKLNGRQFVHCNIYIMMKRFKDRILDISQNREKYIKAIEKWVKDVESAEIDLETENYSAAKVCDNCLAENRWTAFVVDEDLVKLKIRCDGPECERHGAAFVASETFKGCWSCNEYDLCDECWELLSE